MSDDFDCRMKCSRRVEKEGQMCRTCASSLNIQAPPAESNDPMELETSLPTVVIVLIIIVGMFTLVFKILLK